MTQSPVREAAQALLAKIDAAEPYIENLCFMEHNRGRPYSGPTFGSEKEALRTALAAPQVIPRYGFVNHPDDEAAERFCGRMKWKLAQARDRGKSGWRDPAWTPEMISQALREHVEKGDPLDVANYCMFLAARNESIRTLAAPEGPAPTAQMDGGFHEAYAEGFDAGKAQTSTEVTNLVAFLDAQGAPKNCEDGWAPEPWSLRGRVEVLLSQVAIAGMRSINLEEVAAAPEAPPLAEARQPWQPMDSAPLNGDSVLLLIEDGEHPLQDENPSVSIGSYGTEGGPEEDPKWNFAGWSWHQDCYCRGSGTPIGWLPIRPPAAAPQGGDTGAPS